MRRVSVGLVSDSEASRAHHDNALGLPGCRAVTEIKFRTGVPEREKKSHFFFKNHTNVLISFSRIITNQTVPALSAACSSLSSPSVSLPPSLFSVQHKFKRIYIAFKLSKKIISDLCRAGFSSVNGDERKKE